MNKPIYTSLAATKSQFAQLVGADPKVERFWVAAMAATMLAANICNALGFNQISSYWRWVSSCSL